MSKPNALAGERSPYLLQHAHNPVDWLPWGEEAFRRSREEEKPIFLSVGYSTCHWCHVMEEESFENEETAKLMNAHFINVKVDREERPDVDLTYMTFVQASTGQGGWPMSVWLTPELKPFLGGTYFPPVDRQGRAGFPRVLRQIADLWKSERSELINQGEKVMSLLREQPEAAPEGGDFSEEAVFEKAMAQLNQGFDDHFGGFSGAPKFPRPVVLNLLFRIYRRSGGDASPEGRRALLMAEETLRGMACGGIYDHLGGGFHRYSVDRYWHVPHFEKMLYDQAQLAVSYLEAFQIAGDDEYRTVAKEVFQYVLREMTSPQGGFFSAEDADSYIDDTKKEHGEGAFYVWDYSELEEVLGKDTEDLRIFCQLFGAEEKGNLRPESDPMRELTGKNVLYRIRSERQVAEEAGMDLEKARESLRRSRTLLFDARAERPRPHLDDKIITAWNGLMISAFARGSVVLGEERYREAAVRAAEFVREHLVEPESGRLLRSYREGPGGVSGFASDYAFLIQGLLDLYGADPDVAWLKWAVALQEMLDALYFDAGRGGYLSVSEKRRHSILSIKEDQDGAEPAPNSTAALNLLRLGALTGDARWKEKADTVIGSVRHFLLQVPTALPQMAVALDGASAVPSQTVLVAGDDYAEKKEAFLEALRSGYRPNETLIVIDSDEARAFFGEASPVIREMAPVDGKTAVYRCENFVCRAPVTEI